MRSKLLFLLLTVLAASSTRYTVLSGRLTFEASADWRVVAEREEDSLSFRGFAVPRPAGDSTPGAANVMVSAALSHRGWDLTTFGDAKLGQLLAGPGSPVVVDDRTWDEDRSRTVLSRGELRGVPYALWDKFAVRDSIYIDVRTSIPVVFVADSVWEHRYSAQLDSLIDSFVIGADTVFAARTVTRQP